MHSIDGFAFSLIGIFIPIYLLTLNYSVYQVILFFIIYYAFCLIFSFVSIYLTKYFGVLKIIFLRFPFLFAYLASLYFLQSYSIPLILVAFLGAVQNMFYWIPLHLLFMRNTKQKEMGSSTGKLFAFPKIAGIIAPLIGGLVMASLGFKYLIIFVFLIFLLSIIPILGLKKVKISFEFNFMKGIRLFNKYPKLFIAEFFGNMGDEIEAIIWPIFIYLSLISIASIGIIGTLISLSSFIFTLIIGKLSDKYNKKTILKIGSFLLLLAFSVRYFANNEFIFYTISILSGFFIVMLWIPFSSIMYEVAKKNTTDEFIVFREIPVALGRLFILSIALLFVGNLKIIFPITGLAYLYFLFL